VINYSVNIKSCFLKIIQPLIIGYDTFLSTGYSWALKPQINNSKFMYFLRFKLIFAL